MNRVTALAMILLKSRIIRGYMVRPPEKVDRTPENPELYSCVISLDQSKAWQDLVWSKEILGILDAPEHHTKAKPNSETCWI